MLGKLIKYDIRSTWRDFAGIYLAILLGAIFLPLVFVYVNNAVVSVVAGLAIAGIEVASVVITIVMLFRIFNTNVFLKQGYLTMTLPVRGSEVVASKLVVSTMWIVLTGIVSAIGILVFIWNIAPMEQYLPEIKKALSLLGGREYFAIALILIATAASILKEIAKLFLACSIAHAKELGRFRAVLGILSFFVLSWLEIRILKVIHFATGLLPGVREYFDQITLQFDSLNSPADLFHLTGPFNQAMGLWILYALVWTVIFSIGTVWLLNHKLELD
jgi:hypothetical protein